MLFPQTLQALESRRARSGRRFSLWATYARDPSPSSTENAASPPVSVPKRKAKTMSPAFQVTWKSDQQKTFAPSIPDSFLEITPETDRRVSTVSSLVERIDRRQ
ncbi:MAG: hypothetical protein ACYC9S_05850 [Leptospirales bacterium]